MKTLISTLIVLIAVTSTIAPASARVPGQEWKACAFGGN